MIKHLNINITLININMKYKSPFFKKNSSGKRTYLICSFYKGKVLTLS